MKEPHAWVKEFPGAITVCDPEGIILEMNDCSAETFKKDGGYALIGTNALDCHPEPARSKMKAMLASQQVNTYTISKNGVKKLIHQTPIFEDGIYAGFLELAIVIPNEMPHFNRG